jgi:hypothetical protein
VSDSRVILPTAIGRIFWEHADGDVSWEAHRDYIVERVLARGDWDSICWVRRTAGDAVLREILIRTRGRWLSPQQLSLWELLLDLPEKLVYDWLHVPSRAIWDRRSA